MKIIIICNQQKDRVKNLISKVLNGKNILEILIMNSKDLESKNFEDRTDFVIYNSDLIELKNFIKDINHKKIDFGFNENANFRASDVNITKDEINFKLNFKGNSVPIWLKNDIQTSNADEIYNILSAICVGDFLGLNIVEISENLKY